MPAARYRGLKRLRRPEFHACGIQRQGQRDVARDRQSGCAGFCRIGVARGRDCTVSGDGMSAGAVYTPADLIVPSSAVPPGTPFTLQLAAVSFVFVTVAVKVAWAPSTTDPFAGFTVTSITGGGGSDGNAPPALQPIVHVPFARSAAIAIVAVLDLFPFLREKDRMPSAKQAKGQRKKRKSEND
jgi:hypothetical protein